MEAFEQIKNSIKEELSFVVEAGAGSGKTFALVQTLNYLIENKGKELKAKKQVVVCITYTNVAKKEIIKRIEYNDQVQVSTIHEFLWQTIKQYQKQLKIQLCILNEVRLDIDRAKGKESKYLQNLFDRIGSMEDVSYNDSSFRDFEKGELHHDDVIELSSMLFREYPLLTSIIAQKYPYILIDEYQDTSIDTVQALINSLLLRNERRLVLGFYGDSHQKIYNGGIGDLEYFYTGESKVLRLIKKEENYRSSKSVVNLLNNFRTNISQVPKRDVEGSVKFIYWKNHPVKKSSQKVKEFEDSLKQIKNDFYEAVSRKLIGLGWDFNRNNLDKILLLANSRIADRAGFLQLYRIYTDRYGQSTKERLLDRNHFLIQIFTGYIDRKTSQERQVGLEHLMTYWRDKNHNSAIRYLKKNGSILQSFQHAKKKEVSQLLDELSQNRTNKSVGEILSFVLEKGVISSSYYEEFVSRITQNLEGVDLDTRARIEKDLIFYNAFLSLPYYQILNFWKHIQNETVFSTKHGTKGDEYRNVLTVIDDTEWKQEYNFSSFFSNTDEKPERALRTRNLFYVECSRAKENLVVLMLSKVESNALVNVKNWFGEDCVIDIEEFLRVP